MNETKEFHALADELLGFDGLRLPNTLGGYGDSPYLTEAQFAELCGIVCERLCWLNADNWWSASMPVRIEYMRRALQVADSTTQSHAPNHTCTEPTATTEIRDQEQRTQHAHSEDFRSVHWYGEDYSFTPTQAACVRILWEAFEHRTPGLGQATILERAESASSKLSDVFRRGKVKHRAWGTMIVKDGKGTFRLERPRKE